MSTNKANSNKTSAHPADAKAPNADTNAETNVDTNANTRPDIADVSSSLELGKHRQSEAAVAQPAPDAHATERSDQKVAFPTGTYDPEVDGVQHQGGAHHQANPPGNPFLSQDRSRQETLAAAEDHHAVATPHAHVSHMPIKQPSKQTNGS